MITPSPPLSQLSFYLIKGPVAKVVRRSDGKEIVIIKSPYKMVPVTKENIIIKKVQSTVSEDESAVESVTESQFSAQNNKVLTYFDFLILGP